MDPIAVSAVAIMTQLMIDEGKTLLIKFGKQAKEIGQKILSEVSSKLVSEVASKVILEEFEKQPEKYADALTKILSEHVSSDEQMRANLAKLVESFNQVSSDISSDALISGRGTIAQGTNNKAIGERGVYVEGSVSGNVSTGDNATKNKEDE
jgi:hypothetical protein